MATIKDVAREAGVSLGTVSAVLNNQLRVKPENVKKVNDAIIKLDYKVNMVARALKTGASSNIGLIIPDITNPFYPELARGVEDAAKKYGLTVLLCNADRDAQKELGYINTLVAQNVGGIIVTKPKTNIKTLSSYSKICNFVFIDPGPEIIKIYDSVNVEDKDGAMQAMNMLVRYGHRKIAYISGLLESLSAINRAEAYKAVLRNNGIEYREDYFKSGSYDWHSGYHATLELLKLKDVPTAIFAANDIIAIGALKALNDNKIAVPERISVCGFDDIASASFLTPALTTVRQPKYEMGGASVELLVRKINGEVIEGVKNTVQTFATEIVERQTVRDLSKPIQP